jgi:hypothetical protein
VCLDGKLLCSPRAANPLWVAVEEVAPGTSGRGFEQRAISVAMVNGLESILLVY